MGEDAFELSCLREPVRSKKLTFHKFYKQSTKGEMQSQDSPPQVVTPLVHHQPRPKQGATVTVKHGVWILCEDRLSEFYFHGTTGQTFDSPRHAR